MTVEGQMQNVVSVVDEHDQPRFGFYWATPRRFEKPGLYWVRKGKGNLRIIPVRKKSFR